MVEGLLCVIIRNTVQQHSKLLLQNSNNMSISIIRVNDKVVSASSQATFIYYVFVNVVIVGSFNLDHTCHIFLKMLTVSLIWSTSIALPNMYVDIVCMEMWFIFICPYYTCSTYIINRLPQVNHKGLSFIIRHLSICDHLQHAAYLEISECTTILFSK